VERPGYQDFDMTEEVKADAAPEKPKVSPPKVNVGRPSKYKPEFCERILELASIGAGWAEYAAEFGVDRTTLFDWRDRHPEFSTALTRAKAIEQSWFEKEARENMKNRDFNANLWNRSTAARFREDYTERKEVTGANGGPVQVEAKTIDVSNLSPEDLIAFRGIITKVKGD